MIRKLYIFIFLLTLLFCPPCIAFIRPAQSFITAPFQTNARQNTVAHTIITKENELKLKISKDNNKILLLGLIASIFSSALLFYQLSQKHKKEKLLEAYAAETRISKKLHDEIANEIYGTLLFVANEDVLTGNKKDKLIAQLDNIYIITRNISRENNDIDAGQRYPVQLKLMLASYGNPGMNIIVKGVSKINWEKIELTKKIITYRVLQELMVNMQKHSQATVVLLDFSDENKKIKIVYSDNGIGLPPDKVIFKNGLANIENRLLSVNGSVIFDAAAGSGFHLTLTYPANTHYV